MQIQDNTFTDKDHFFTSKQPKEKSISSQGLNRLKQMPNLAVLPEVPPSFDFWGVLPVVIDPEHLVALIILVKAVSNLDQPASQGVLSSLWAATKSLQTCFLSSYDKAEQFAAMLSGGIVHPTSTEGGVDVIQGPDGHPTGFYLGPACVQVVMTCVLLPDGPASSSDLSVPFPFIANDLVDTYLLPPNTDFAEFARYLVAKNQQGWRGKRPITDLNAGVTQREQMSQVFLLNGSGILTYTFAVYLLAPSLLYSAFIIILVASIISIAVWVRAWRAGRLSIGNYLRQMSWRTAGLTLEEMQEISSRLSPIHASQFSSEMNIAPFPSWVPSIDDDLSSRPRTELTKNGHSNPEQAYRRPDPEDEEQPAPNEQQPHVELAVEEQVREEQATQDDASNGGDANRVAG